LLAVGRAVVDVERLRHVGPARSANTCTGSAEPGLVCVARPHHVARERLRGLSTLWLFGRRPAIARLGSRPQAHSSAITNPAAAARDVPHGFGHASCLSYGPQGTITRLGTGGTHRSDYRASRSSGGPRSANLSSRSRRYPPSSVPRRTREGPGAAGGSPHRCVTQAAWCSMRSARSGSKRTCA
jgi:hypothetical protein